MIPVDMEIGPSLSVICTAYPQNAAFAPHALLSRAFVMAQQISRLTYGVPMRYFMASVASRATEVKPRSSTSRQM